MTYEEYTKKVEDLRKSRNLILDNIENLQKQVKGYDKKINDLQNQFIAEKEQG